MQQKATECDQKDRKFISLGFGGEGKESRGRSHGDRAFVGDLTYRQCIPGHFEAFGCRLLHANVMAWTPLLLTASVVPEWKCQATTSSSRSVHNEHYANRD
jgi:hypothetical protein